MKVWNPVWLLALAVTCSCATAGNTWLNEPLATHAWNDEDPAPAASSVSPTEAEVKTPLAPSVEPRVIRDAPHPDDRFVNSSLGNPAPAAAGVAASGRGLGTSPKTYYQFPSEAALSGE